MRYAIAIAFAAIVLLGGALLPPTLHANVNTLLLVFVGAYVLMKAKYEHRVKRKTKRRARP